MLSLELGLSLRHESWDEEGLCMCGVQRPELGWENGCAVEGFDCMRRVCTMERR